jgi:hypothetical protein
MSTFCVNLKPEIYCDDLQQGKDTRVFSGWQIRTLQLPTRTFTVDIMQYRRWGVAVLPTSFSLVRWPTKQVRMDVPQQRRLVPGFLMLRTGFDPRSGHVGFVVDKVALGQGFSKYYFGFPCQSSFYTFYKLLHAHPSTEAGTKGPLVASVPSGFSLTPLQEVEINKQVRKCKHRVIILVFCSLCCWL